MSNVSVYDELDQAIDQMLSEPGAIQPAKQTSFSELVQLAQELRDMPLANFKKRLQLELECEAAGRSVSTESSDVRVANSYSAGVLPSLFGKTLFEKTWAGYPVRRINFALSVALHGFMAFLVGAGFLMVKSYTPRVDLQPFVTVRLEPYRVPVGSHPSNGGGSGGAAERIRASRGAAPPAAREQLTPPIILRNNLQPRLAAATTVIAPPDLSLPRTREIGDPLSVLTMPSNGPGVGGGIGGKAGGGVGGDGGGSGRGPGSSGGCCGNIYSPGDGVSIPRAIYSPEPEFSEEARRSKYQGEVTLLATITADGRTRDLLVVRSLGMGLDEKAIEAVRTWRFEPARKDGRPVAVQMNIIVSFHLF
ncbi:MAG TPA: energy transducer TonB [Candidatus Angelobacter sp.]